MMLFKISLKNMKKSFKDYAIYFFTLILGVAVFYVFNAMDSQTAMLNVSESTHQLIAFMNTMLSGISIFVSIVLGFLIIYASRFLIKRRKKEFGIYLTLGMSKTNISKILLIETILIGILSMVVGLGFGVFLSQFMSMFAAKLFEADMSQFTFVFSFSAMVKTILYFALMYIIVMLFNTISVGRCKLIDLLQADKKNERIKIKRPIFSILLFMLSIIMLSYAYYSVAFDFSALSQSRLITCIILGGVGTFLFFFSASGFVLKLVQMMRKTYFKHLNMFVLRQVNSKINTTVWSMTVISLMLFLTIGILSSALSIKDSMSNNLKTLVPVDIMFSKRLTGSHDTKEQAIDRKRSIEESLKVLNYSVSKNLVDVVTFPLYQSPDILFKTTLDPILDEVKEQFPALQLESKEDLVRISDYNKVAKLYGLESFTLKEDEFLVIADFDSIVLIRNKALQKNRTLILNGKEYKAKYQEVKNGFLQMSANHINTGIFLFPDEAFTDDMKVEEYLIANYRGEDKELAEQVVRELENHEYANASTLDVSTKLSIYEASVGLGAIVTFIGIYLGIIFLITSAAILALKELSESSDNIKRYQVLRKIGVDEGMIHRSLFLQIGIFFIIPLLLAMIHSVFGLMFSSQVLITFADKEMTSSIGITACFLVAIYGGYFLLTYFCSRHIISEKE